MWRGCVPNADDMFEVFCDEQSPHLLMAGCSEGTELGSITWDGRSILPLECDWNVPATHGTIPILSCQTLARFYEPNQVLRQALCPFNAQLSGAGIRR
jgi:hypothetical protein